MSTPVAVNKAVFDVMSFAMLRAVNSAEGGSVHHAVDRDVYWHLGGIVDNAVLRPVHDALVDELTA